MHGVHDRKCHGESVSWRYTQPLGLSTVWGNIKCIDGIGGTGQCNRELSGDISNPRYAQSLFTFTLSTIVSTPHPHILHPSSPIILVAASLSYQLLVMYILVSYLHTLQPISVSRHIRQLFPCMQYIGEGWLSPTTILELHLTSGYCKGDCKVELNQILAGDPKSIYY